MKTLIRYSSAIFILGIGLLCSLSAEQKQFTNGFDDNWSSVSSFEGTQLKRGKEGFLDIVLRNSMYKADDVPTDILLHFEQLPLQDSTGNHSIEYNSDIPVVPAGRMGDAAAFFSRGSGGINVKPGRSRSSTSRPLLLTPGMLWNDFTIEFWLRPEYLENGETILRWEGQRGLNGDIQLQEMSCTVKKRVLSWRFENFFLHPDSKPVTYSLSGRQRLVPERWSHHMIRFEADTGMLEYLVDGTPEAIVYTTLDSGPGGTVLLPFIGTRSDSVFSIGSDYAGLMDEFRLAPDFVSKPLLQRLPEDGGEVVIGPIDLEEMGSQVLSIDVDFIALKGSSVFSYYRIAENNYDFILENPDWTAFTPGVDLDPPPAGSYLEIKLELFPDGSGMDGPAVSSVAVDYRPNLPPPAPVGLTAVPHDGAVHLNWGEINQRDLGGYLVYYGTSPGVYRGDDAGEGASPIDVGKGTELRLTSLKNGQLYYFAVAAYDAAGPSHRSRLSREISARPSAYYGE